MTYEYAGSFSISARAASTTPLAHLLDRHAVVEVLERRLEDALAARRRAGLRTTSLTSAVRRARSSSALRHAVVDDVDLDARACFACRVVFAARSCERFSRYSTYARATSCSPPRISASSTWSWISSMWIAPPSGLRFTSARDDRLGQLRDLLAHARATPRPGRR